MREETALEVIVGPVIDVFDRITRDVAGRVEYHYVLVDYLCWPARGDLRAGSDAVDAVWVDSSELALYRLGDKTTSVIARGFEMAAQLQQGDGECH